MQFQHTPTLLSLYLCVGMAHASHGHDALRRDERDSFGWRSVRKKWVAARFFTHEELGGWLWETWKFVKQIFPHLIFGMFAAGLVKAVLPQAWVQSIAGRNKLLANMVGVFFGDFYEFSGWWRC